MLASHILFFIQKKGYGNTIALMETYKSMLVCGQRNKR